MGGYSAQKLVANGSKPGAAMPQAHTRQPPEPFQTQNRQRLGRQPCVAGLHQDNRTMPFQTAPLE